MNVAALTAAIRRQTSVDSTVGQVSDANILIVINEGVSVVSSAHRWPFLESAASIGVTAATAYVATSTFAADLAQVRAVVRTGKNRILKYVSFDEYLYRTGDDPSTSTEATHYTLAQGRIYFYPTPSATEASAYKMYFWTTPTDLTTGSPAWATQFHYILVDYACYRLWEREEYFDESRAAYGRFQRGLADMYRWYNSQQANYPMIYGDGLTVGWDDRLHLDIW